MPTENGTYIVEGTNNYGELGSNHSSNHKPHVYNFF